MAAVKHFIGETVKKVEIDDFLAIEFERAGYGGVDIAKTPLGTHVVVYAMRPGLVIGRGGETIRNLAQTLEEKFHLPNPQISVAEIEIPEFNAYIIACRVASALKKGVHFRRAGFWALNQVMEAGALGAEIIIRGKLRTDRARYEKFRAGYLPKSGHPPMKYMHKATLHVQLKQGMFGVKVYIMPPDAKFPDRIEITEAVIDEEAKEEVKESKETKEIAQPTETAETEEAMKEEETKE
jgi:small subunit ribosomal protein S3